MFSYHDGGRRGLQMKKYNSGYTLLTALLIFLVGISAILLFGSVLKNGAQKSIQTPSPIPTNPETGWNIYLDEETGFYFEYPSNYVVEVNGGSGGERNYVNGQLLNLVIKDPENATNYSFENDYNDYFSISIDLFNSVGERNIDTHISQPICESKSQAPMEFGKINVATCKQNTTQSFKPFTTGSIKGKTATIGFFESGAEYYAIDIEPYFVQVAQWGPEGSLVGENPKKILNQIISTFRVEVVETWKTYRLGGIRFEYPEDFSVTKSDNTNFIVVSSNKNVTPEKGFMTIDYSFTGVGSDYIDAIRNANFDETWNMELISNGEVYSRKDGDEVHTYAYIRHNKNVILIQYIDTEEHAKLFDKIISSFKIEE
jgi:hypothetical protein